MSELFREGLRRLEQEEQSQPATMAEVLALLRSEAKAKGLNRITKREINAEIATARKERYARKIKAPAR